MDTPEFLPLEQILNTLNRYPMANNTASWAGLPNILMHHRINSPSKYVTERTSNWSYFLFWFFHFPERNLLLTAQLTIETLKQVIPTRQWLRWDQCLKITQNLNNNRPAQHIAFQLFHHICFSLLWDTHIRFPVLFFSELAPAKSLSQSHGHVGL